ncbi:MAG TPA: copper homeostasis protein CutC [Steroidobacteraceae bacterium]|nr:copper homeostasis protein CutC [Steroidobacteraceae bacterium]
MRGRWLEQAAACGVDRIELCQGLDLGGLTPSFAMMRYAASLHVPTFVLIRPRPGDFFYTAREIDVMIDDIHAARHVGIAGVVLGVLNEDHSLNREALRALLDHCAGLGRTLHRGFDLTPDLFAAADAAVELGFDRILTSGGAPTAMQGARTIAELARRTAGLISIMPGGGIRSDNVAWALKTDHIEEVHASCTKAPIDASPQGGFDFVEPTRSTDVIALTSLLSALQGA